MRRSALLAAMALLVVGARAAAPATREDAGRVAPLFARLRAERVRPEPASPVPRRLYVVVPALTAERRAALEAAGLVIERPRPGDAASPWPGGEVVQGLAAATAESSVRALPFVIRVETPGEPWSNVGAVTTAGDTILGSAAARATLGTDGTGVSVGVISDGIDDVAASAASGDLPADIVVVDPGAGQGDEGTALLEIVHDVAPGARLLFSSPRTSVEMLAAIDGLANAGAQVIVDDVVFTDEPKFEDGPVALAARRFTQAGGIYVTSAGNFGATHYFAPYNRVTGRGIGGIAYGGVHAFASGDFGNGIRIPAGGDLFAVLQWNDAFGASGNDLDLLLARATPGGDTILAGSTETQNGTGNPYEALRWTNTTGGAVDAYLAIGDYALVSPPAEIRLNLVIFSRVALVPEYDVRRESMFGHATVDEVLSVAAADAATPGVIEPFSSAGPASIFFPVRATRQVPRLTAVDAVETAVGRRGQFANPFRGTSAAAPHVAGCAALVLAAGAAPAAVAPAMVATAVDIEDPGVDSIAGAGRLDCSSAAAVALGRATPPVVSTVAGIFDATGAVQVDAVGEDAEGDVRSATVRLLAPDGSELERTSVDVSATGTAFGLHIVLRGGSLAQARTAAVAVRDAAGLVGAEMQGALTCPGDGTIGDALCVLGDLIGQVATVPGRAGRRLSRRARAAAAVLSRAGELAASARDRAAGRALRRAAARLRALERALRHDRVDPGRTHAFAADAAGLRARLLALRATFT